MTNGQWTEKVDSFKDSYVPLSSYKLYFNDEFNGPSLNRSKWYTRYIYNNGKQDHLNDEIQRFRDNNNHVFNNGILSLVARKMVNSTLYESGMIRSVMETHYGYFEARVKMPNGLGVWPAFWLNSGYTSTGRLNWPPEIDIFEFVINGKEDNPGPLLNMLHSSVVQRENTPSYFSYIDKNFRTNYNNYYAPAADFTKTFSTIGLEWTPSNVSLFVNGTHVYTRNYTWVYPTDLALGGPAHVLLNFAVGGSWAGRHGVNETAFPLSFEIDWVRVFKPIDANNGTAFYNGTISNNGTVPNNNGTISDGGNGTGLGQVSNYPLNSTERLSEANINMFMVSFVAFLLHLSFFTLWTN